VDRSDSPSAHTATADSVPERHAPQARPQGPFSFSPRLLLATLLIALVTGSAGAGFLWSLEQVTRWRWAHPGCLLVLPVAGVAMGTLYRRWGKGAGRGTNLLLEAIRHPGTPVPARLAPFILGSTLLTHLCGGSAGREGTAVQMGGGIAAWWIQRLGLPADEQPGALQAGLAAGFGAVFGTPLAGAVFALEVDRLGRLRGSGLLPCLAAAFLGDSVCRLWGAPHTHFQVGTLTHFGLWSTSLLLAQALALGVVSGGVARGFVEVLHRLTGLFQPLRPAWLTPVIGASAVLGLSGWLGTDAYLGLGITHPDPSAPSLVAAFHAGGATPWSWLWKLLLTALTLAAGFKGGEVTPLFFIGATLGHVVSPWLGLPVELGAALGFVAVFAGASNTPIACTLLGCELFGWHWVPFLAAACTAAYLVSGHAGIYSSQLLSRPKWPRSRQHPDAGQTLGELR
jgi:H+/Cl- antiporter ClcA